MSYIVLDLEWNQAMSSNASVFNRLPIHLSGEIIQIGAVRLKDRFGLDRKTAEKELDEIIAHHQRKHGEREQGNI